MDENSKYRYGFDPEKALRRDTDALERVIQISANDVQKPEDTPHPVLVGETISELKRRIKLCGGLIDRTHLFDRAGVTVVGVDQEKRTDANPSPSIDIAA